MVLDSAGQSSVEAAVLLSVVMFLLALLVQPVCLLYTRMVMGNAAGEAARVLVTAPHGETARSYALRRLEAVPLASLFHVGGREDWDVRMRKSSDGRAVTVRIAGHARPMPFFGELVSWAFERDERGLILRVEIEEEVRPAWLEGGYEEWMAQW